LGRRDVEALVGAKLGQHGRIDPLPVRHDLSP
jgi:hypothetical protein